MPAEPVATPVTTTMTAWLHCPADDSSTTRSGSPERTGPCHRHLLDAARAANTDVFPAAVLTRAQGITLTAPDSWAATGGSVMATATADAEIATGPHTYPETFEGSTWGDIPLRSTSKRSPPPPA